MVMDRALEDILGSLPNRDTVRLTRGELLLLDWVLCTGSSLLAPVSEDLMDGWHEFRLNLWNVMPIADPPAGRPSLGVLFTLSETDAKVLLATTPTTFAWGDGFDVGFSLKEKLAARLLGSYVDPQPARDLEDEEKRRQKEQEDASENTGETPHKAPSPPPAGC